MWRNIEKHCRTRYGYGHLRNVNDKNSVEDRAESFFFAETAKYLYLLFKDDKVVDLTKQVFTLIEQEYQVFLSSEKKEIVADSFFILSEVKEERGVKEVREKKEERIPFFVNLTKSEGVWRRTKSTSTDSSLLLLRLISPSSPTVQKTLLFSSSVQEKEWRSILMKLLGLLTQRAFLVFMLQ